MKHRQFYTFVLIVLVVVAFATSPANAQTTAPGPYYASPSWDQKLQCDTQSTCPRFVVLSNWNNQAVLDRETGLVWERSPSGSPFYWYNAQYYCNNLTLGNRYGWRLPTVQELASLLDPTHANPSLPSGHPFQNLQSLLYWSATAYVMDTSVAWGVYFDSNGGVFLAAKSTYPGHVWCVRGGQGVDPQ